MNEPIIIQPPVSATERPHADRSSSQLGSLAVCPGFKNKKDGKRIHWITQQGQRGHEALQNDDDAALESAYEEKLVQMIRDYVATLPPATVVLREYQFKTIEDRWGYADEFRFRGHLETVGNRLGLSDYERDQWVREWRNLVGLATEADLVDHKFVKVKEVKDAEVNLQGKDYVIAAFEEFRSLQKIHVHFPMPRFGTVTTATFTREMLPQLKLEVFAVLATAKRTDGKRPPAKLFNPSYEVCRYCSRAACPALYKLGRKVAEAYAAEPLPELPANVHASEANDPKVLGALKTIAAVLEPWAQSVNHHSFAKAIDEAIVADGYEIAYQKGQRKVTNPFAVFEIATKDFGLHLTDVIDASKISVKQLEDAIKAKAPRGQKAKQVNAFNDELRERDAIERSEDKPHLARKIS